jgi:hydrogenase maturation protein HypF
VPGWSAVDIRVRGVVQGVGFRPFVFRLAREHAISGWVLNAADGVHIHAEGRGEGLAVFVRDLEHRPPEAAHIDTIDVTPAAHQACTGFSIRDSIPAEHPTTRVSPDLPVCRDCLAELFDPANRRAGYPYITCTNCGPRYSIVLGLPYDRPLTTMREWPLCAACAAEYHDPGDRRFHAQPLACPSCGPSYVLYESRSPDGVRGEPAITTAATLLRRGAVLAVKGIGGYHLSCAAREAGAVLGLRERKFRKEKPFAVMVRDVEVARALVDLDAAGEALLTSSARPIVVAAARDELPHVASGTDTLGVMLPYAPLHHLLFAAGAPDVLVMTSGNASSEPIAYDDEDARVRLSGIADAWLVGERHIARRVEDSITRAGAFGPVVLRRARGYAPGVVARLPSAGPVLAMGADLKAAVTLVVGGEAVVGPHIGDLEHHAARQGYEDTIRDLLAMWQVDPADLTIVHDAHP